MEVVLNILLGVPSVLFLAMVWVMLTSKGECYFCGHRFEKWDLIHKARNKKTCSDCLINKKYEK